MADWKSELLRVTLVPTVPAAGEILVIRGTGGELLFKLLLTPATETVTGLLELEVGTVATSYVSDQLTTDPVPLKNLTVLFPGLSLVKS